MIHLNLCFIFALDNFKLAWCLIGLNTLGILFMSFTLNWSLLYLNLDVFTDDLLNTICLLRLASSCGLRSWCLVIFLIVSKEFKRLCDDWLVFFNECKLFVIIIVISPQFWFWLCLVRGFNLFNLLFKKCYFVLGLCRDFKCDFRCIFILFVWTFENYFRILFLTAELLLGNYRLRFNLCRLYWWLNRLRFLSGLLLRRGINYWFILLFRDLCHSVWTHRNWLLHIEWSLLLLRLDSCTDRSHLLLTWLLSR